MKKCCFSILLFLVSVNCFSQSENPVKWDFEIKKIADKTYELQLIAKIEDGWHIYSQSTPDGGPIRTSISYSPNPLLMIEGAANEIGKLEKHFEKLFGVEVIQFSKKVIFLQIVKLKTNAKTNLSGKVKFMVCNDKECLPPKDISFSLQLK
ncbi:MAG TPA: protein-disulfide reductase DsbD domain-containing protein [Chitinophagaceae bacterium]|nr:protein-disulfide reductase DsbD domain-containing protein [Chitinophagaceae bacterium]